jgi:hypothetical protein
MRQPADAIVETSRDKLKCRISGSVDVTSALAGIGALPYRHERTIAQTLGFQTTFKVAVCLTTPNPNSN